MLVRFSVRNVLSFRDEAVLDLAPTKIRKYKCHVLTNDSVKGVRALRFAGVFGPNAAGKTNLVKALGGLVDILLRGADFPFRVYPACPFRLSEQSQSSPMEFRLRFISESTLYEYFLAVHEGNVVSEALTLGPLDDGRFVFNRERSDAWFVYDPWGDSKQIGSAQSLLGGLKRSETILGLAQGRGFIHIDRAFEWLTKRLVVMVKSFPFDIATLVEQNPGLMEYLSEKMQAIDAGISRLTLERKVIPLAIPSDAKENLGKFLVGGLGFLREAIDAVDLPRKWVTTPEGKAMESRPMVFAHTGSEGKTYKFNRDSESDGTLRSLDMLPFCYLAGQRDYTFVIDEFDRSLHSMLSTWLLKLFSHECNKAGTESQLIFTAQDNSILQPPPVRDDEIWFVEKNAEGASKLFPLTDFKLPDKLNRRTTYLEGRFGAVPYLECPEEEE